MKIKTQNGRPMGKPKTRVNKKRLFFVFFSAFAVFFFLCSFIASMISPKIDAPALNEDGGGNLSNVSSDDFKGKLDPRLKDVESNEGASPNLSTGPQTVSQSQNSSVQQQPVNQTDTNAKTVKHKSSDQDYDELPYDNRNSDLLTPEESSQPKPKPQRTSTLPKHSTPVKHERPAQQYAPQPQQQQENNSDDSLILRDKVKVQNDASPVAKVMVGNYTNPAEARMASRQLAATGLNVLPFVREKNGSYSVQVGSFSSAMKAHKLAAELRKRNIASIVTQE